MYTLNVLLNFEKHGSNKFVLGREAEYAIFDAEQLSLSDTVIAVWVQNEKHELIGAAKNGKWFRRHPY